MKRRIVFALISVLICVGAAVWLVPYTPVPDMDGFWNVRIWRVNGADMTELTEQVNQTALREVLTQVKASRVPHPKHSFSMDKISYETKRYTVTLILHSQFSATLRSVHCILLRFPYNRTQGR